VARYPLGRGASLVPFYVRFACFSLSVNHASTASASQANLRGLICTGRGNRPSDHMRRRWLEWYVIPSARKSFQLRKRFVAFFFCLADMTIIKRPLALASQEPKNRHGSPANALVCVLATFVLDPACRTAAWPVIILGSVCSGRIPCSGRLRSVQPSMWGLVLIITPALGLTTTLISSL